MTHLALMQILGPETCKQMIRDADAEWESENGIFVSPDDMPDPITWELGTPDPLAQLGDDAE